MLNLEVGHFLFDYDGLLVNSEKLYFETWCLVLSDKGKNICRRFHEGRHENEVYEKICRYLKKPMTLEEVSRYRRKMFNQLIGLGRLELKEGVRPLLERFGATVAMSIVSNSGIGVVRAGLKSTGIERWFDNLFCFNQGVSRKPSPDLYHLAVKSLNLQKSYALAFEDSPSGIISAEGAGVPVVCINSNPSMENFCLERNVPYFRSAIEFLTKIPSCGSRERGSKGWQ